MDEIRIPAGAKVILDRLHECGEKAYVVGGCVRDSLMGREPHDWDICTSATPEVVKEDILSGYRIFDTGLKHGTVSVLDGAGDVYEVTTFRTESGYSDGRHPDKVVFVSDVRKDLARRDFTINAMAYNDEEGLVDPFGGKRDLAVKLIRCVGDPNERFSEDALRILRAIRFSAQFGFCIDAKTEDAMRRQMHRLDNISAERIGSEFRKIVCAPDATFAICSSKPVICEIIPEMTPLICCGQNNQYHNKDVFGHTMQVLHNANDCESFPKEWADDGVRMALFFHDFGKPAVKTIDDKGYDHFYGHPAVSAEITENVLRRLRYSNDFIDTVVELVKYHDIEFAPNKRCARRMLNKFSVEQLQRLLKIRECDNRAHSEAAHPLFQKSLDFYEYMKAVLEEKNAFSIKDLAINGRDLIERDVEPGPEMGKLLRMALDAVMDEQVENRKEDLLMFILARMGR